MWCKRHSVPEGEMRWVKTRNIVKCLHLKLSRGRQLIDWFPWPAHAHGTCDRRVVFQVFFSPLYTECTCVLRYGTVRRSLSCRVKRELARTLLRRRVPSKKPSATRTTRKTRSKVSLSLFLSLSLSLFLLTCKRRDFNNKVNCQF